MSVYKYNPAREYLSWIIYNLINSNYVTYREFDAWHAAAFADI